VLETIGIAIVITFGLFAIVFFDVALAILILLSYLLFFIVVCLIAALYHAYATVADAIKRVFLRGN
jgi:hypothetical protein